MARWQTAEDKQRYLDSAYFRTMCDFERKLLRDTLTQVDNSVDAAAELLGVSRAILFNRIKTLGGVLPDQPAHKQTVGSRYMPRTPPRDRENESKRSGRPKKSQVATSLQDVEEMTEAAMSPQDIDVKDTDA